jgi:hypothetical protein
MICKMAHKRSFSEMTNDEISDIQQDIMKLEENFELLHAMCCEDYNRIMHRSHLQDFAMVVIIMCMWVLIAKVI